MSIMQWKGVLGLAKEASWGDWTAPSRKIAINRGTQTTERLGEDGSRATANRYMYRSVLLGLNEAGDWEQDVSYKNIGEILYATFGGVSSGAGPPYTHTYSIGTSLPSYTLSIFRGISATPTIQVAGFKVNTLTLENEARGILHATVEGVGKMHRTYAALTLAAGDHTQFKLQPFVFKNLAATIGLGGGAPASDTTLERVSITIDNQLQTDEAAADGSYYISGLQEDKVIVTGAFDKEFTNYNEFNQYIANGQLDVVLTWTRGNYSLSLDIPDAVITNDPLPEISGAGRQMLTVEFTGQYSTSDSKVISGALINDVASY